MDLGGYVQIWGQLLVGVLPTVANALPAFAPLKSPRRVSLKTSTQILEACKLKACRLPGWLSGLPGCLARLAVWPAWLAWQAGSLAGLLCLAGWLTGGLRD